MLDSKDWFANDDDSSITPGALLEAVGKSVHRIMSQDPFDTSHDYTHIERVVALAEDLLYTEQSLYPDRTYDRLLVVLAAMLHDVGDSKYVLLMEAKSEGCTSTLISAEAILLEHNAPPALAKTVQRLVSCISCSYELKHPTLVNHMISQHPELAIVQDADRLDALGATGIARAFTFGGAHGRTIKETRNVFESKLLMREGMMRTAEGKRLAGERCERLRQFMAWWLEERSGQ